MVFFQALLVYNFLGKVYLFSILSPCTTADIDECKEDLYDCQEGIQAMSKGNGTCELS